MSPVSQHQLAALKTEPQFSLAWAANQSQVVVINQVRETLVSAVAKDPDLLNWVGQNSISLPAWADRMLEGSDEPFGDVFYCASQDSIPVAVYGHIDGISAFLKEISVLIAWVEILVGKAQRLRIENQETEVPTLLGRGKALDGVKRNKQEIAQTLQLAKQVSELKDEALEVYGELRTAIPALLLHP